MKTLLTALAIVGGALLPATQIQAAPAGKTSAEFAPKKFGEFKAGDTFKLKITDVNILSTNGKIPKGIPKFKKGSTIKFKIGKKGQLTGPGFNIKFVNVSGGYHTYLTAGGAYKLNSSARVAKEKNKKPSSASIAFNLVVLTGTPGSYQVTYTF